MIKIKLNNIQLDLEYLASKNKPEIHIICGMACSGKSTFSKELLSEHYPEVIRVNRDDIRTMLFGLKPHDHKDYYSRKDLHFREKDVNIVHDATVRASLSAGKNVVADNAHTKIRYINDYKKYGYPINVYILQCELDTAIERCLERDRVVGEDIIARQEEQIDKLIENFRNQGYEI